MEEHRLTPMKENFDEKLFNDLYKKTNALKRKLAYQIDCRRLGVDYDEILSWFDVKFIFIFNKYFEIHEPEILKGHIISGFQFFKQRILRTIYSQKNQVNDTIDISECYNIDEMVIEDEFDENGKFIDVAMKYLKQNLSAEAYLVLQIELNPPLFILAEISKDPKAKTSKIPPGIIADFLGMDTTKESIKYINSLRKETQSMLEEARDHFQKHPILI